LTGRPTKLTKALIEQICRAIRAGNYPAIAAQSCGVAESTFYRWMEEGRTSNKVLRRDFYEEVKRAEAEAEVRAVVVIAKEMPRDWRAAIGLIERRFAERWRRRERSEIPAEERPAFDLRDLSEKELKTLEKLSARIAKPDRD
jgi:hypothetical protein